MFYLVIFSVQNLDGKRPDDIAINSVGCLVLRRCHCISTMHLLAENIYMTASLYHTIEIINTVDKGFKSSIFIKVDVLLIRRKPSVFHRRSAILTANDMFLSINCLLPLFKDWGLPSVSLRQFASALRSRQTAKIFRS